MVETILEVIAAVGIVYLGFWLGLKRLHWSWRKGMIPPSLYPSDMTAQERRERYTDYFGTWEPRDL